MGEDKVGEDKMAADKVGKNKQDAGKRERSEIAQQQMMQAKTAGCQLAVLGANTAMGEALINLLAESELPLAQLFLLSTAEEAGEQRRVGGKTLKMQDAADFDWSQAQIAFFVADKQVSASYAKPATSAGCVVIDGSGLFAHLPTVPLVVPGVNDEVLEGFRDHNIIALADSLSCQLLLALQPLRLVSPLLAVQVTALLAASAQGDEAVEALARQSISLLNGQGISDSQPFAAQLAFNTLPLLPDETGVVPLERQWVEQVRRILADDELPLSVAVIQVPVFYGHGQLVSASFQQPLSAEQGRQAWQDHAAVSLMSADTLPTQVTHASQNAELSVGCVRENYGQYGALQFWSVADNIQFTSGLLIQLAQRLVREHLFL